MSQTKKAWVGAAVALAGAALLPLWPPAAIGLSFAGLLVSFGMIVGFNVAAVRAAATVALLIHAATVFLSTDSFLLGLAAFLLGFSAYPPNEHGLRILGGKWAMLLSPIGLAAGVVAFLVAGRLDAWALSTLPTGLLAVFGSLMCVMGIVSLIADERKRKPHAQIGEPAPDFELPLRLGSDTFRLSSSRGQFVLLCFLRGDWCPVCQVLMRVYKREAPRLRERNVKLVMVNPDSGPDAEQFAAEMGLDYTTLVDSNCEVARQFGAMHVQKMRGKDTPLPLSFLIDPEGIIRYASKPDDISFFSDARQLGELLGSPEAPAAA